MSREQAIFERVIRRWWASEKQRGVPMHYAQLAVWALGQGGATQTAIVAQALGRPQFHAYLPQGDNGTLTARWSLIDRDFPELCGGQKRKLPPVEAMLKALKDEHKAAQRQAGRVRMLVNSLQRSTSHVGGDVRLVSYAITSHEDEDPAFDVGNKVVVMDREKKNHWKAEVGRIDEANGRILLFVDRKTCDLLPRTAIVADDPSILLKLLADRIDQCLKNPEPNFGQRALLAPDDAWGQRVDASFDDADLLDREALNAGQRAAVLHACNHRLSAIWGPPGTGKTHALARLIFSLALRGERVLVIAPSNIALDQVALRLLQIAEHHPAAAALVERREVLRFGYPKLAEVKANDKLYPDLEPVRALNAQIRREQEAAEVLSDKADAPDASTTDHEKLAVKLKLIRDLIDQRRGLLDESVNHAQVVLTTASMCAVDETLHAGRPFDTVVYDESSMLSPVLALPAAALATERLVVVGDFQQLPPVVLAATDEANHWLKRDLFDTLGVVSGPAGGRRTLSSKGERRVCMLEVQHRMDPAIAKVPSDLFYDGRLRTARTERPLPPAFHEVPRAVVLDLDADRRGFVQVTKACSRVNPKAAEVTVALAESIRRLSDLSIAVIAPYRAHIHHLRKRLAAIDGVIQVGTIHTMQGSEADVVIWDLVDVADRARRVRAGALYRGADGNRLFNVAATRARELLVIIGHRPSFIEPGTGIDRLALALQHRYARLTPRELHEQAWLRW